MPLIQWLINLPPWQHGVSPGNAFEDYLVDVSTGPTGHVTLADMSYSIIQGDLQPDMVLTCTLDGGAPATAALTGALSVQMRWKRPDLSVVLVDLVTVSAQAGTVKRVWVAGDSDQVGTHFGQVVVTTANGELETFPSDGSHAVWNVYDKLQPGH